MATYKSVETRYLEDRRAFSAACEISTAARS